MTTSTQTTLSESVIQIKATLLYTKPPIWRRVLVPPDLTLEKLHIALQISFGWDNSHLHDFEIEKERYAPRDLFETTDGSKDERKTRLSAVLGQKGAKAVYSYDYGDGWEHSIEVEKIISRDPGVGYPRCTGGARQCPPEDCGGVPGFYQLLKTLRDPADEQHEEMKEWLGREFDPTAFAIDEVNSELAALHARAGKSKKNASSKKGGVHL